MTAPRLLPPAAALLAAACLAPAALGQAAKPSKAAPSRVAVIDMAEVFAQYDKFEDVRDSLEKEIEASSEKSKQLIEQMQKLQQTLQSGTYKQDSEEYVQAAANLNKLQTDLKVEQTNVSRKFMKKEAENYKQIYAEVTKAVGLFCKHRGYSMVIRYRREAEDESQAPGEILQGMNRLVVYNAPEDDITDLIVGYLDGQYAKTSGKPVRDQKALAKQNAAPAARQAAAPGPARR